MKSIDWFFIFTPTALLISEIASRINERSKKTDRRTLLKLKSILYLFGIVIYTCIFIQEIWGI